MNKSDFGAKPVTGGSGGIGDVVGPSSATDNAIARYDSTTGKLLQNSAGFVDDNGNVYGVSASGGEANVATAAGTTTLTVASKQNQVFTGSTTQTIVLPVVTTLPQAGYSYSVFNDSSGIVTVNSSGSNLVQTMAAGSRATFTANKITADTTAAAWEVLYVIAGAIAITSVPYDLATQIVGKPDASAVVLRFVAVRSFTLNASGHQGLAGTGATAQTDFAIAANGVSKGSLRFAAAGTVASIVSGASASVTAGQLVTITAPAQDATLADISLVLNCNAA